MHQEQIAARRAAPPSAGRDGVPPLRRRTATRSSTPAPASRGAARSSTRTRRGATPTSAACRRSTTSRSTSTCCARPSARQAGLRRDPRGAPAAADVQGRGRADLRVARRGDRLRQPGVRRAAGRRADVPRVRPDVDSAAEQRVLAPAADAARRRASRARAAARAARRARARRRRRSRSSGTRRRGRAAGRAVVLRRGVARPGGVVSVQLRPSRSWRRGSWRRGRAGGARCGR